jgi:hypothetical protein
MARWIEANIAPPAVTETVAAILNVLKQVNGDPFRTALELDHELDELGSVLQLVALEYGIVVDPARGAQPATWRLIDLTGDGWQAGLRGQLVSRGHPDPERVIRMLRDSTAE